MRPSFIYHQITAVLEIIGSIIAIYWIYKNYNNKENTYKIALLILIMALLIGLHAIVHFWEEAYLDFNPMIKSRSTVFNDPIRD